MSKVKNQHFVPRAYLRRWADAHEKIWVYDAPIGKLFLSNVKNVASESYFYDTSIDDILDPDRAQFIERLLAELEGKYQKSLKTLLTAATASIGIDVAFKREFGYYLWVQWLRTPKFRDGLGVGPFAGLPKAETMMQIASFFEPTYLERFLDFVVSRTWVIVLALPQFQFPTTDAPLLIDTSKNELEASLALIKTRNSGAELDFGMEMFGLKFSLPLGPQHLLMLVDGAVFPEELEYADAVRDMRSDELSPLILSLIGSMDRQVFFARRGVESEFFLKAMPIVRRVQAEGHSTVIRSILERGAITDDDSSAVALAQSMINDLTSQSGQ